MQTQQCYYLVDISLASSPSLCDACYALTALRKQSEDDPLCFDTLRYCQHNLMFRNMSTLQSCGNRSTPVRSTVLAASQLRLTLVDRVHKLQYARDFCETPLASGHIDLGVCRGLSTFGHSEKLATWLTMAMDDVVHLGSCTLRLHNSCD